jgi:Trypsin-like peptidase domain
MNFNKKLKDFFKKVETKFSPKAKLAVGVGLSLAVASLSYYALLGTTNKPSSTVMVSNLNKTSGGSGVILKSSQTESLVLTNAHVCGVVERGGWIITSDQESHAVYSYYKYPHHDLCMIKVRTNLGKETSVATSTPMKYDSAQISGHPALLPNVLSDGHFGGHQLIQIVVEIRECTPKDMEEPEGGLICNFFGFMPIFQHYDSVVVTAMIMGGSSGSAVYTWKNDVGGLVFAGQGKSLSYAYCVPFEFVNDFTANFASYKSEEKFPDYNRSYAELLSGKIKDDAYTTNFRTLKNKCLQVSPKDAKVVHQVCEYFKTSTLWLKDE